MSDLQRPTGVNWAPGSGNTYGQVQFGDDNLTLAVFYTRSVLNEVKSAEHNRPIHENHTYVRIQPPGERLNIMDRPVRDEDKRRWPQSWNDYINNKLQVPEGTPVEILFANHPAIADNLKGNNVYTVEQLAQLSSNAIDNIGMGAQDWCNKAKAFLEQASGGKNFAAMSAKLETLEAQNRILNQQLQQAIGQIRLLEDKMMNPQANSIINPIVRGAIDPVVERINNTHITKDISEAQLRAAKVSNKMEDPYAINTGGDEF